MSVYASLQRHKVGIYYRHEILDLEIVYQVVTLYGISCITARSARFDITSMSQRSLYFLGV